ncbi:MAG: hypothetical protein IAG13_09455 [Deltaproteobacteria bacterium]|nr:hypothetical protein [Nannocystaceae bacterium]
MKIRSTWMVLLFATMACVRDKADGEGARVESGTKTPATTMPTSSVIECHADEDCAPNECCHATWCAPVEVAANCEGKGCSLQVIAGTLDGAPYGGTGCRCLDGRCGARLNTGCVVAGPQPKSLGSGPGKPEMEWCEDADGLVMPHS